MRMSKRIEDHRTPANHPQQSITHCHPRRGHQPHRSQVQRKCVSYMFISQWVGHRSVNMHQLDEKQIKSLSSLQETWEHRMREQQCRPNCLRVSILFGDKSTRVDTNHAYLRAVVPPVALLRDRLARITDEASLADAAVVRRHSQEGSPAGARTLGQNEQEVLFQHFR